MEKSENVSKLYPSSTRQSGPYPLRDMLPFSGLGFDLAPVLTRKISVVTVDREGCRTVWPLFDTVRPSGRWLQLRLGREIRGR